MFNYVCQPSALKMCGRAFCVKKPAPGAPGGRLSEEDLSADADDVSAGRSFAMKKQTKAADLFKRKHGFVSVVTFQVCLVRICRQLLLVFVRADIRRFLFENFNCNIAAMVGYAFVVGK